MRCREKRHGGNSEPENTERHFLSGVVEFWVDRLLFVVVLLLQIEKLLLEKPLLPASEVICLNVDHEVQNHTINKP